MYCIYVCITLCVSVCMYVCMNLFVHGENADWAWAGFVGASKHCGLIRMQVLEEAMFCSSLWDARCSTLPFSRVWGWLLLFLAIIYVLIFATHACTHTHGTQQWIFTFTMYIVLLEIWETAARLILIKDCSYKFTCWSVLIHVVQGKCFDKCSFL